MKQIDHRTRVTCYLIQKAFTNLLKEKPIQSISIRELCEKAGINRGTFYAHYQDIYDLLEKMENDMMQDFLAALEPLLGDKNLTPLAITASIFQCIKNNSDICAVTLGKYGDKTFAARLITLGREKCMASYVRYFVNATPQQIEYYYAFVSSGCIGLLEKWMDEGMTTDLKTVAAAAENIMMHGIGFLANK